MEKQSNRGSFWKIIATIGGVGGLVAICGLIIAVAQLGQAVNSQNQQNIAQVTEVAFDQAHLDELVKIVTLQAKLVEGQVPNSTATAIAAQINELQSTIIATEVQSTNTPSLVSNNVSVELPEINQNKSMFAVLVGVTNETAFSLPDAMNYTYMASVQNVDEAIVELSKVFDSSDTVYVVHVPNLRITPGNPGSCKLYLQQVERLKEYPLGWIIGGDNIVPDQFESGLAFCYGQ